MRDKAACVPGSSTKEYPQESVQRASCGVYWLGLGFRAGVRGEVQYMMYYKTAALLVLLLLLPIQIKMLN